MQNDLIHTAAKNAAQNFSLRCQPRILIDVSDISGTDWKRGNTTGRKEFCYGVIFYKRSFCRSGVN